MNTGRVTAGEVDDPIREAESGRRSHRAWLKYRQAGGADDPGCGDGDFHESQIVVYDRRLRILRAFRRLLDEDAS